MSTDIRLAWHCPHLTIDEHVALASDRRTLLTSQPVAVQGQVRVSMNDGVIVPQAGLFSVAELTTGAGPFLLKADQRELVLETSEGRVTLSIQVQVSRATADSVVRQVLAAAGTAVPNLAARAADGRATFADVATTGARSVVRVTGSAAKPLGFGLDDSGNERQWAARGRRVLPGWQLEIVPGRVDFPQPRFLEPLRGNPVLKVSYAVPGRLCRRCGGTRTENDARVDATGQAIMVRDEDLLYQAALKILLTDKGSNPYHGWYGSSIRDRIGSKAIGAVAAAIGEDVRRALAKLQQVQNAQADFQPVTARERLYAVLGVRVLPHVQDPTTFLVEVDVQNASSQPVSLSIVYSVPEVVSIMSSNGLLQGRLGSDQYGG